MKKKSRKLPNVMILKIQILCNSLCFSWIKAFLFELSVELLLHYLVPVFTYFAINYALLQR